MMIGFTGRKQSGKSTAASALIQLGYAKHSFADPLRAMVYELLRAQGLTEEEIEQCEAHKEATIHPLGVSMRHLLQTLGTDWGRSLIHPGIWVLCEKQRLEVCWPEQSIVYDDVRFEDEAAMIRSYGGKIVHIYRPGLVHADSHISEQGIAVQSGDVVLDNCGNAGGLLDAVLALVDRAWS